MGIQVERVANGYLVRDFTQVWVVEEGDDELAAVREMLLQVNRLVGRPGSEDDAERVVVGIEPGRRWLEYNPEQCRHSRLIEHWAAGGEEGWRCPCGAEFQRAPAMQDRGAS